MTIGIFYASKYGTTEEAVKGLEKNLKSNGASVEIFNIKKDKPVLNEKKTFDLILVGGSIYMGKIQKEVTNFCEKNEDILLNHTLGLFLCCGSEDDFESQLNTNFSEKIINHTSINGYFGYGYNLEKMNFLYRKIIKKVANISSSEKALKDESIKTFAMNAMKLVN